MSKEFYPFLAHEKTPAYMEHWPIFCLASKNIGEKQEDDVLIKHGLVYLVGKNIELKGPATIRCVDNPSC